MGFDMNYKIKVANEAESKEVQGLLEKLGFKKSVWGTYSDYFIFANSNYYSRDDISNFSECDYKEITLPELRDLVVLKRNDVGDATHTDPNEKESLYFRVFGEWWNLFTGGQWQQFCHAESPRAAKLKPIEKKDMKEYLIKINGAYKLCNLLEDDVTDEYIEIPEGSVKAYLNRSGTINFVNADDDYMNGVTHGEWVDTHRGKHESSGHQLVWQRESMKDNSITKDYLEKQADGSYVMKSGFAFKDSGWIEIPEGATYYAEDANLGKKGNLFFRLRSNDFKDEAIWLESNWMRACFNVENQKVLWQRESPNDKLASAEQYRQAEVLPFIDDEPDFKKLADLLVETTKHKPAEREWDLSDYDFAESDAWIESNVEQDNVNNPSHYADSAIECIDAMQAMLTPEQFIGYLRGNVAKYLWRYEKKNGKEDLSKAIWYLNKLNSMY